MSTLLATEAPALAPGLRGSRLTARTAGLAISAGLLATVALFTLTSTVSVVGFVVVAALLIGAALVCASMVVEGRRRAFDRLATGLATSAFLVALIALGLVVYYTAARGLPHVSRYFLTHSMAGVPPTQAGGGIYHAIVGTLEQVLLSSLLAVPLGLLVSVYITEYGRGALAAAIRFFVDVMTGIPSIVAGLFIYAFYVLALHRGYSGFAGALALAILQLPIVIRAAEEMIRLVPESLREASYALGVPRWRTILRVVLPTASAGITTGVMLAIARVTGETAPLILTAFDNRYINTDPFHGQQSSLALFIYNQAQQAYQASIDRAWAAAATLIVIVVVLYLLARLVTRRNTLVPR